LLLFFRLSHVLLRLLFPKRAESECFELLLHLHISDFRLPLPELF
jgi:hypothetical protein